MRDRSPTSPKGRLLAPLQDEETTFHAALLKSAGDEAAVRELAKGHLEHQSHGLATVVDYERLRDLALANVPMDERLVLLLSGTRTLLASDVACVLLLDAEGKELWPRASVGFETAFGAKPLAVNGSIRKVLEADEALLVNTVEPEDRFRAEIAEEGIRSLLAAPVHVNRRVQGVLVCGHKSEGFYTDSDKELLGIVADRMGAGLGRRQDLERVTRQGASARRASRFKTELLHMATHDLKTPLAALTMQLDMMAKFEQTPEQRKDSVAVMRRTVKRLNSMLDDFLDLARVEANRLAIKPTPLAVDDVFADAAAVFQAQAAAKGIRLAAKEGAAGLKVSADERRLAQVTANLLSNAIRYAPAGTTVKLGAHSEGEHVALFVQDEGIGLTPEQIAKLFRPFSQVQGIPAESEGTGLGLYLSSAIVRAHGGKLWLESDGRDKGVRAVFTLPRVQ